LFKDLFRKLGFDELHKMQQHILQEHPDEIFFSNIIGNEDIKKLLMRAIIAKDGVSYCLVGPPASAKSVFLQEMEKGLDNAIFIDGTGTSGRGLVDLLTSKPNTKYLLIDEIDKMTKRDVAILYNVLETGRLQRNTKDHKYDIKFKGLRVFATSNSKEKLPKPLQSRIQPLIIHEYSYQEFEEISIRLLTQRYKLSKTAAIKIASGVWIKLNSKDIRRVLAIGRIAKRTDTENDIDWLIDTHAKHTFGQSEFN
jgi:Holliday junction resolvasome RuvABC ATP-dependent DNA helicase subunit